MMPHDQAGHAFVDRAANEPSAHAAMTGSVEARWTPAQIGALASLAVTASAFAFTNVMFAALLPEIQNEFGRGAGFGGLVFNISLATAGTATPLIVLAASRYGNKRVILAVLTTYVAMSLVIGLFSSSAALVSGRAVWGLIGTLVPCSYALSRTIFTGRPATIATALVSGAVGISGGLGLISSAVLRTDYQNVALTWWLGTGLVALVMVVVFVPGDRPDRPTSMANARGITSTSFGVLFVLLPLLAIRWTIDHPIVGVVGVAIGIALLVSSDTSREMLAPNATVTAGNIMNVLGIAGFFALYVAVPAIVVEADPIGWSSDGLVATAIILLFPSIAALIGSQASGRLAGDGRLRMSGARIVTVSGIVSASGLVLAALSLTSAAPLLVGLTLAGLGAGGAFNGIVEAVSRSGPVATRTGTLVAGRYVGGALGGATVTSRARPTSVLSMRSGSRSSCSQVFNSLAPSYGQEGPSRLMGAVVTPVA